MSLSYVDIENNYCLLSKTYSPGRFGYRLKGGFCSLIFSVTLTLPSLDNTVCNSTLHLYVNSYYCNGILFCIV